MEVSIQIISLVVSFVFGVILYFLIKLNKSVLLNQKGIFNVIFNILFCINCSLVYLIIIKNINSGIINLYFIITILLGYVISNKYISNFVKSCQKYRKRK